MKLHGNARTCPNSRRLLVERVIDRGLVGARPRSGRWRFSSAPSIAGWGAGARRAPRVCSIVPRARVARPGSCRQRRSQAIRSLRRLRMTAAEIAEVLGLALSTVSLWLKRIGLGKRSRLEPPEPPNRYERRHPGELVHVDIKQLGRISARGAGHRMVGHRKSQVTIEINGVKRGLTRFEYVHVMIDDHTRLAYAEVLPTLTARCAIAFLRRGVDWFASAAYSQGRDERQRLRLRRPRLPPCPHRARAAPPTHPALPTPHQRQGGALHPDPPNEWAYERIYGSSRRANRSATPATSSATTSDAHTAPSATNRPHHD